MQVLSGGTTVARMVLLVGDFHSILRYDPCAIMSEGVCYEQSNPRPNPCPNPTLTLSLTLTLA